MSDKTNASAGAKPSVPALDGWFTLDTQAPNLIGSQCDSCGTYYFPTQSNFCKNPACDSESFSEVLLSRKGKVWSYTNSCYKPPEPFISADPFEPYAIAAVELAKEKMIVLGQVVQGVDVSELRSGMEMELVLETLFEDEDSSKLTWKWKPVDA